MNTVGPVIRNILIVVLFTFSSLSAALAQGAIAAWGGLESENLVTSRISGADFIFVSGGSGHSLALRSDGSIVISANSSSIGAWFFETPKDPGFTDVDVGFEHGIALKADGSITSWGDNSYGQVSDTPTGHDFIKVTAGEYHSAALKQDGSIVSWGYDYFSQVSNQPGEANFVSVEAGANYSLALRQDGSMVAWGDDFYGQVSTVPTGNDIASISAGGWHGVALKVDGTIISWGADYSGQVSQTPVESGFIAVAGAGSGGHSIGLKSDGSIAQWGAAEIAPPTDTNYIAIAEGIALKANGSVTTWNYPEFVSSVVSVPPGTDYTAISAGGNHLLTLREDGSLLSWGDPNLGAVHETPTGTEFIGISAAGEYSIALKQDGSVVAWGESTPDTPPTGNNFVAISAGYSHSVALKNDGSITSWGEDDSGQVSSTPTSADFTAIAAGEAHSIALRADGSLASWGTDFNRVVSDTPSDAGYSEVSAGGAFSIALRTDGSIVAWGLDDFGQVTDAPNDTDFVTISADSCHAVAQHSDGSLTSWGCDGHNQVSNTPSGTGFIAITAGIHSSYALTGSTVTAPSITTPMAGTTLATTNDLLVEWAQGNTEVTDWWLYVGSSFGAGDIYDSGLLSASDLQETITNIPADGSSIYIRLWFRTMNSPWDYIQQSVVATGVPPAIHTPVPGSELNGAVQLFEWQDNGSNVTDYQLFVGSSIGLNDYYNSGLLGAGLVATAVGLPVADNSTVYVRLWYKKSSGPWAFTDSSYQTGVNPAPSPVIINREPGTILAGMTETFEWDANGSGATHYWLQAGPVVGTPQYFNRDMGGQTSAAVSSLPTNGSPVWVRLWYRAGPVSPWDYIDYEYIASGTGPVLIASGGNGNLAGPDDTFSWTDPTGAVTSWWLYIGSTLGGRQHADSGKLSAVNTYTTTGGNLPSDGGVVHARLWYQQGSNTPWRWIDRQFISAQ